MGPQWGFYIKKRKIFENLLFRNNLSRRAEKCVEASSGSVHYSLVIYCIDVWDRVGV